MFFYHGWLRNKWLKLEWNIEEYKIVNNPVMKCYFKDWHTESWWVNSLGPRVDKWCQRQNSWSTLVRVMACCLTTPSHYPNQCWLLINELCSIHLTIILHDVLKISFNKMSLKITLLQLLSHLPGINDYELTHCGLVTPHGDINLGQHWLR